MSCTVMYQPYAMSYSSSASSASSSSSSSASCEKSSSADKKVFKLPQAPSPPDSLHSDASPYNSPGPSISGQSSNHSQSRRPLTPGISHSTSQHLQLTPPSRSSTCTTTSSLLDDHQDGGGTSANSSPRHSHHHQSHIHHSHSHTLSSRHHGSGQGHSSTHGQSSSQGSSTARAGPSGNQVQYLSGNAAIYINYNGDASRTVDEHFSRALSEAYSNEKVTSKCLPMSMRKFPASFWNSAYQPTKSLTNYGAAAAEFYGAAVEYGSSLSSLGHHHQADPWHYQLPPPHQTYHHRPTEIPYPPITSSRFNASQYGSFLLAGAAASSGAGRFGGMATSGQCGVVNVKGVGDGGSWPGGRYHHHHHDSHALSDLHNLADYSAAAAAHYSNMAAGLESTVVQDTAKDLYWF